MQPLEGAPRLGARAVKGIELPRFSSRWPIKAERARAAKPQRPRSGPMHLHQFVLVSNAIRSSVAMIRLPATNVPRTVPETLETPPARRR
jgi:hypothetical protein